MPAAPLSVVEGSRQSHLSFEHIDQGFQLKIRALVGLCMAPVMIDLHKRFDLQGLRAKGTIPIMFSLQFETEPQPLVFGGRVETRYRAWLRRSVQPGPPGASAGKVERLLLDMDVDVSAEEAPGDRMALGAAPGTGRTVHAGRMRGLHVLTRPVAPPGERQVATVPEELRGMQEHPFSEPYPSAELLQAVPSGFAERETGPWQELRSVFALHNTDVNQHVNVIEYITGLENHFARMLYGANVPVARHRIARMAVLFRKPFFSGDAHALRGRLFLDGARTLMLGGVHRVEPEGGLDPRPSVATRMEGVLQPPV
jgi:hypothetical protein